MPLFNARVLDDALVAHDRPPTADEQAGAAEWASRAREKFGGQNESQLEGDFAARLMHDVLGYRTHTPNAPATMRAKPPVARGIPDLALGAFSAETSTILAPVELKGPRVRLDALGGHRARTPVQQAWDYANDAQGARWVLVCNMVELRLYAVGHGREDYHRFDLTRLDEADELAALQLLLHADRLLGGATAALLERSASADKDITDQLYATYRSIRDELLQFVADQRPAIGAEARVALVQKLVDRVIFIAFAEDTVLIPDDSLVRAIDFRDPYAPQPRWAKLTQLFAAVDKGSDELGVPPYNGGLFAPDAVLDGLDLPDALVERFKEIAAFDFASEVSVTILGHIFEQSISDIEALLAEARGEEAPTTGKRKRDGVVYTPPFVTRFIVDRTLGATLREAHAALLPDFSHGPDADGAERWRDRGAEGRFWRVYLARITSIRVLDPACGSGAFLIAAFDQLEAEQRRVRERLGELEGGILVGADESADLEIATRSLYGVDVNTESVEITKLALWLKTAKTGRPLERLSANIRVGNSLIEDSDVHRRAFVWRDAFGPILADGGFDVVIGNPPYVRMELLKPIKPYLQARYEVVSDRADLYAYFFELGVRVLRPGGRLGYISSSTFFRTGSGAPLRDYLARETAVEAVVDFGDRQLFEGVTTYPAVLIVRKGAEAGGTLDFWNADTIPDDLELAFADGARPMSRARLARGGWRFEDDALARIRDKMATGRRTLAEVHGAPLYGIKTGLNDAFVLDRATRDAIVAADPGSAALLKPFLVGENLKRWHVDSDDLWLIYTPKGAVDIDAHPGVRDHLVPFRERLEERATKQGWWELQQAQAAYARHMDQPKLVWPHFQNGASFSVETQAAYLNNKCFFMAAPDHALCGVLNSAAAWFQLTALARMKRGGYLEAEAQYVGALHLPELGTAGAELGRLALAAGQAAADLHALSRATLHRLDDLAPALSATDAFRRWPDLSFADLRALIAKRFHVQIPVAERDEWDCWFTARRQEADALSAIIADAEAEIDDRVFALFDLDAGERRAVIEAG